MEEEKATCRQIEKKKKKTLRVKKFNTSCQNFTLFYDSLLGSQQSPSRNPLQKEAQNTILVTGSFFAETTHSTFVQINVMKM